MAFSIGNYWLQRTISLKRHSRGCHYVTDEIKAALPEIKQIKMGVLHLFAQPIRNTCISYVACALLFYRETFFFNFMLSIRFPRAVQHTSATLIVNESWDPSVKTDIEMLLNRLFPESLSYKHSCEGPDDMADEFRSLVECPSFASSTSRLMQNMHFWAVLASVYLFRRACWHWELGKEFGSVNTAIPAVSLVLFLNQC
ncbi:uncharacterized protein DEA37_0014199 [Paragonimus westermani]|uniref:Uncharacterized protein n=1 Tax=Paragonimus westermani TaxID=34504 RepID=A0A5J4NF00_9TREM|nr:uncharacterized protein DEA37_0014199 [Paragonimus westermani]